MREDLHATAGVRRLPGPLARWLRRQPATQDALISAVEYVLAEGRRAWPTFERYRREDRRAVNALYRRVFGIDAAEASRLRWEWQYRKNPNNPGQEPEIWIAHEGPAIIGQYATMPVRLTVRGNEVRGSWAWTSWSPPNGSGRGSARCSSAPGIERRRVAGLGLSESSYRLFQKLRWPDVGPVPCFVKPLTRRALRRPTGRGRSTASSPP